jgi:hypothetical protein
MLPMQSLVPVPMPTQKRGSFLYLALGFAAVMVAVLAAYTGYLVLSHHRAQTAQNSGGLDDAESAILSGTPKDLTKADAILSTINDVKPDDLARARLHAKILRALDISGKDESIGPAIDAARANGASAADLAAGELALAVIQADDAKVDSVLKNETDAMHSNAFYELAAGAALEHRGDATAIDRYDQATKDEPKLTSSKVRSVRAAILEDRLADAEKRLSSLDDSPNKTNLAALLWVAKRAAGDREPAGRPASLPTTAEVLRPLNATYAATAVVDAEKGGDLGTLSKRGIDEADVPSTALLFGRLAESRGDPSTAIDAAKRALALAPRYRPAVHIMTRAVAELGKLDLLKDGIANLDESVTRAARAFLAYERGDLSELEAVLAKIDAKDEERFFVQAERDRLVGDQPLASETIKKLEATPGGGDLVAMDALLDAGNLEEARDLAKKWTDPSSHLLRARRYARLNRYEGNLDEAALAIRGAAPSQGTAIEQALIRAEIPAQRPLAKQVMREKPPELSPELAKMLEAYVIARDEELHDASEELSGVSTPGKNASLPVRMTAALAFGEAQEKRGETLVKALYASFPQNPDVKRAAEALKVTKGAK